MLTNLLALLQMACVRVVWVGEKFVTFGLKGVVDPNICLSPSLFTSNLVALGQTVQAHVRVQKRVNV